MAQMKRRGRQVKGSLFFIPVDEITPSPVQPRKYFCDEGLEELSESIREYGILQPLSVRMRNGSYELIAGERRLRAAKMVGLTEVPCIVLNVNMEQSSLIALVENLQRRDLDVIEEAEGIAQLIRVFGMSQEEAARRLGKSQPAIANKLRLLRLPPDVLERLRDCGLSERHGRALLRLPDAQSQREALEHICSHGLNVSASEAYIEYLLSAQTPVITENPPRPEFVPEGAETCVDTAMPVSADGEMHTERPKGQKKLFVFKDVRIFLNTVTRYVDIMRQGGVEVAMKHKETDSDYVITINVPKSPGGAVRP